MQKHKFPKSMGHSKSILKREIYSNTGLSQKQEKSQINILTFHLKELEKEWQTKHKVSRRNKIIKIRMEIKKKTPQKKRALKLRTGFFLFVCLFLKISKTDKPLARLTKRKRERAQIK